MQSLLKQTEKSFSIVAGRVYVGDVLVSNKNQWIVEEIISPIQFKASAIIQSRNGLLEYRQTFHVHNFQSCQINAKLNT